MNDNHVFPVYLINDQRKEDAPFGFATRGVACPDGVTRMVTLPLHMWDWYDFFAEHEMPVPAEQKIEEAWQCTLDRYAICQKYGNASNKTIESLLCESLYHSIDLDYKVYNGIHDGYNKLLEENPIEGLAGVNWKKET